MKSRETQAMIEDVNNIKRWHHDRNLIDGSDDKSQFAKLIQEAGELSDNICKGNDIKDDIGDMIVVLINIAERNDVSITECIKTAWEDIKDRKGMMRDGVFVKQDDLIKEALQIPK
jgi:NTP pyrophosphatase (non-canonical NTP hydrolase)|tara:strand:- start:6840 stop:7187 length:348 start_codon:yes stop_codon:yes gene_type:complete